MRKGNAPKVTGGGYTVKRRRVMAFVSAAVMAASIMLSAAPVMAAGTNYDTTTIGGTATTTFDKYLVMDQDANVPNATFTYEISAGDAIAYDVTDTAGGTKKFQVLAGVNPGNVTMAGVGTNEAKKIAFSPSDTTATDNTNNYVKDFEADTEKYAKKTATLDFSQCTFPEPGVYRYKITESGENQAITNDADLTRIVDVYVVNDDAATDGKKLKIEGYVLHSNENDSPVVAMGDNAGSTGTYTDTKSQGFTNTYDTADLTIRKEVSGNQASKDKYFKFTVTISNAVAGTVYDVDRTKADATTGTNAATVSGNAGQENPTKITVPANATEVTTTFYLQHGQEITIQGIAKGSTYTVTEEKEDYKSTPAGVTDYADDVNGTIGIKAGATETPSNDVKTSYLNTRSGVIPTGLFMAVVPFAAITVLGGAGAAVVLLKKKNNDEDEEE